MFSHPNCFTYSRKHCHHFTRAVIDLNSILTGIFVSAESDCRAPTAAERWLQSASEDKCSLSGDSGQKHLNSFLNFYLQLKSYVSLIVKD